MKRATKAWLSEQCVGMTYVHGYAKDALDCDASQRAEIRRHRRNMETLRQLACKCGAAGLSGFICAPCRYVREALAPKRGKR